MGVEPHDSALSVSAHCRLSDTLLSARSSGVLEKRDYGLNCALDARIVRELTDNATFQALPTLSLVHSARVETWIAQ